MERKHRGIRDQRDHREEYTVWGRMRRIEPSQETRNSLSIESLPWTWGGPVPREAIHPDNTTLRPLCILVSCIPGTTFLCGSGYPDLRDYKAKRALLPGTRYSYL